MVGLVSAVSLLYSEGLHHRDELQVVDFAVVVDVYALDELVNLVIAEGELVALETLPKFFLTDGSVAVFVEVRESSPQLSVLQVVVTVKTGRDELRVINQSVLVGVDDLHGVDDIFLA